MLRVCFLFAFLIFFCAGSTFGQTSRRLNQSISITFDHEPLSAALVKMQGLVRGGFSFDPSLIPDRIVNESFTNTSISTILRRLLAGTGLSYTTIGRAVVIIKKRLESFTIDGHVRDRKTGEVLIGASIYIPILHTGAVTNQYGFYSLTIPEGNYRMVVSNLGYDAGPRDIELDKNITIDHNLTARVYNLMQVNIEPNITDSLYAQTSAKNIPTDVLNRLPYYAGEVDVVKAIQMRNGVKALTEGSSGLYVRGGNIDQNLITLDEAMIYNPSHLFGLVSIFNSDAIKNIKIYDDHMPASFGGRLASVVDVRMADGNDKEFHVSGGASLLSLRLAAEGPIKKEVGSFLVTFRRSLIDLLNQNFKIVNPNSAYYDVNLKTNYRIDESNRFFYSFYYGNDHLFSRNSYANNWGNITSTFRWNHVFNSRLFFNLSAIYSNYKNLLDVNADTISQKYQWHTGIRDLSLKGDFTFYKNPTSEIQFGGITTLHRFVPGEARNAFPIDFNIPRSKALENAMYVSHQVSLNRIFKLSYGLRAGMFNNGEERTDLFDKDGNRINKKEYFNFVGLEPRLYFSATMKNDQRLHLSYGHNYQYLQLIQNNELSFSSLETWMPSSKATKPQSSDYWSAGYDYFPAGYKLMFNLYYKKLYNQLTLLNHAQVIQNPAVRQQLTSGISRAYGAELTLSKKTESFSGEIAYSFARVFRKIANINDGERYPANYDIPHDLKLNGTYSVNDKLSISSFFTYSTGRPVTLPVGYYVQDATQVPIFEGRNGSRMPGFHRLDLSAQYNLIPRNMEKHKLRNVISIGVFNVYNRKNALFYRIKQGAPVENAALFESTTGVIPWLAYTFKY